MPKAPAKKKPPVAPVVPPTPPPAPAAAPAKPDLPVLYDKLDIVEYSVSTKQGPLTVEDAKQLLGWETEKEYQQRKVKEEPNSKPEHWLYGDLFHCRGVDKKLWDGAKVRTNNNAHNRAFDEGWCEDLIHTIVHGQWAGPLTIPGETVNGETVRVSRYGRILSGQHQLTALILADECLAKSRTVARKDDEERYPFWAGKEHCVLETVVITGLSEDPRVLMTIDYCKPRTAADVFYTSDVFKESTPPERKEMCRMLSAACDLLWTRTDAQGYKTHPEVVGFLERHKRLLKAVEHLFVENSSKGPDGGRRINSLRLSAGQAAALCYLMGCSGPKSDGDVYRNESPPTEKGLDWSYWDRAREFWAKLARTSHDKTMLPVRKALGRLMESDTNKDDNVGMGGRMDEKLAILAKAWYLFRDDGGGVPFTDDDLEDGGALSLSYTDTDPKGNKWPDGKITLIDVADFAEDGQGIDCPQVIDKKLSRKEHQPPAPVLNPTREEIERASQEALQRREAATKK